MAYLGKSPSQGVRNRYYFTASGGETSISGALTGGTLTFTDGNYVDVNLNGVTLVAGTDYNTSTANTIAGLSALTASDVVEIVVYDVFSVFSGNVNSDFSVGGNLSVTGTTAFTGATTITGLTTTGDINFGDNDKAIFGAGSDLQIYHDGSASRIVDSGTGGLTLQADANVVIQNSAGTETKAEFTTDGGVNLYYDNSPKLATTSSGIDVTGGIVVDQGSGGQGISLQRSSYDTMDIELSESGFRIRNETDGRTDFFIDGSGKVGVNCIPDATFKVVSSGANLIVGFNGTQNYFDASENIFRNFAGAERGRFNSAGALLIGKTSDSISNNGISAAGSATGGGHLSVTNDGNSCVTLNRKSSDGTIMSFATDGSTGGSIGVLSDRLCVGQSDVGLFFDATNNTITPFSFDTFDTIDNHIDLGIGSRRFQDIFASNGTIQTSDENEKQNIASLTSTEITAAKAISALFKTYKWKDAAASKGDAARTHTGVIAQEVQAAMSDAGLDAANYAFWCYDTWWETSTDVPAVEAVEAADAVYDDDGNEVSAAVMPVEAKDAYTRIDTYHTADEAPDGATQRTRMGIRYPELLAFIGAATEQRLTDIEARIAALEAE